MSVAALHANLCSIIIEEVGRLHEPVLRGRQKLKSVAKSQEDEKQCQFETGSHIDSQRPDSQKVPYVTHFYCGVVPAKV